MKRKKFDPYEELGLEPGATPEEIDKAFRARAKETHPDAGGDPAEFQRAKRAVALLRNPKKRKHYDDTGDTDDEKPEQHPDFYALTYIGAMIGKLCEMENLGQILHLNLAEQLVNGAREDMSHLDSLIGKHRQGIARAEKLLGRFKRKTEGLNLIEEAVKNRIRNYHEQIADAEKAKTKMARAIEILKEFTFDPAEDPNKAIFRHFELLGVARPSGFYNVNIT
jgi:curved DNA-binding protein CbpA